MTSKKSINLSKVEFLVADANPFYRELVSSVLYGFGAREIVEASTSDVAVGILKTGKIKILICDAELEDMSGFQLVRSIRSQKNHPCRSIPMLISTGSTQASDIRRARDAGANMVIKRPMSPEVLYDRLVWIACNPRAFWESDAYYGPDRRIGPRGNYKGPERRQPEVSEADINRTFEVPNEQAA